MILDDLLCGIQRDKHLPYITLGKCAMSIVGCFKDCYKAFESKEMDGILEKINRWKY